MLLLYHYILYRSRTRFRVNLHPQVYSYLNTKQLLVRKKCDNWSLSDSNRIRNHNHLLVRKRTINHLAKLGKWWSCILSSFLYSAFDQRYYVGLNIFDYACRFTLNRVHDIIINWKVLIYTMNIIYNNDMTILLIVIHSEAAIP